MKNDELAVKDITEENELLYKLAKSGDVVDVLRSLASGADLNFVNEDDKKRTPLHIATIEGNGHIVMLLAQNRANVNAIDELLKTPLHYASEYGNNGMPECYD